MTPFEPDPIAQAEERWRRRFGPADGSSGATEGRQSPAGSQGRGVPPTPRSGRARRRGGERPEGQRVLLEDERQAALSWARDRGAARPSIRAAKMMTTSTAYLMEDGGRVVGLVACAGRQIWGYVDDGTEALRRFRQLPGREVGRAACRGWADG